jgi:hypothetical protein
MGIEAPPGVALPTSETYKTADELFATSHPFIGAMPPNKVWAFPPAITVPLPSMACDPAELITGKGAIELTGVAMPEIRAAGACSGTRLPELSNPVDNGCIVVFASLTNNVTDGLLANIHPQYD